MFQTFKLMNLAGALKAKGNAQEAYSAVLELGRIGNNRAVDLLLNALRRMDGVARSAARELGKLQNDRAISPLLELLGQPEVNQAAADALLAFGPKAVGPLLDALRTGNGLARESAAAALGELRDTRAVEPLIGIMQTDDVYAVRTAAATALGQLKDSRAVWVLVQTLQLRDETTPERQSALERLRHATQLAMRKIGDPLAAKKVAPVTTADLAEQALEEVEQRLGETETHPRLLQDPKLLNPDELLTVMKDLITASEEISWAALESREPMVQPYFRTYEQRVAAAETVGRELLRRGGRAQLQQVLADQLGNNPAIGNWWNGLLS
jgi:hypothetical protein